MNLIWFAVCILNSLLIVFLFFPIHSISGFATAVVFKDVTDADVAYAEKYAREKIPELLAINQQEPESLNKQQLKIFFGAYAASPSVFEFTLGHRKLIKAIVKRINDTIADSPNEKDGLAKWNQPTKSHWWKNLCTTPLGLFYGDIADFGVTGLNPNKQPDKKQPQRNPIDVGELKQRLFDKAKKVIMAYKQKVNQIAEFSEESISVKIVNGTSVEGIVTCNCCSIASPVREVKMFYNQTGRSGYWLPSNLDKHFLRHHLDNGEKGAKLKLNMKQSETYVGESETSVKLEIEPMNSSVEFESNAIEDFLYMQMSKQNIRLVNQTWSNEEEILDFFVDMDLDGMTSSKTIKICKIEGNGSCLYGSLYHQISFCSIGTADHKKHTKILRQECVDHIRNNFDRYLPYLKSRIIERDGHKAADICDLDMNKKCREFLDSALPLNKTFGGVESIKAVSELKKVNIITITENGSCNLVHLLNTKFDRSVFIAYRNGNHYDSVAEIDANTLSQFAKKLAYTHNSLSNGKNPIIID